MSLAGEIILVLVVGAALYEIARVLGLLGLSLRMTRSIKPYEQHNTDAALRILLIGDSTAYGTGSTDSRHSISGRIAADFPTAHVENWSETGSKLNYVRNKLLKRPASEPPFDLVIIMAGGMNVVHATTVEKIRQQLREVIAAARTHGRQVMLVAPHNAGHVPMFRPPLSWFNEKRAHIVEQLFIEAGSNEQVPVVSLLYTNSALGEQRLYSKDKTHPNDGGYALWYEKMRPVIHQLLAPVPALQRERLEPIAATL
jgi:lysophospholipase L1-like esterase